MKKLFAFLLAFVMILSLCACGNEKPQNEIPENEVPENESKLSVPEVSEPEQENEEPEPEPEEKVSTVFRLGTDGEEKEISVGDTIGEWVLAELSIQYNDSTGEMVRVRAYFEGEASFEGYIERNVLLEEAYDFIPDSRELERMPSLVSEEFTKGPHSHYILNMPEDFGKKPDMDWNETADAKVNISGFTINYAFTMTADGFDVTDIEYSGEAVRLSELHKLMLIDYGAKINNGVISPADSAFNTFSQRGFENTESITDYFYYSWYFNHMHRLELSQEELEKVFASPFGENTGWAYPAEYFEPAAEDFFGVSPEELHKRDFYYPEHDCYYIYTGPPGIGEIPEIIVNSIDYNDNTVVFHITVDYSASVPEDYDMALTVKILPDGTYNYVSYLPE